MSKQKKRQYFQIYCLVIVLLFAIPVFSRDQEVAAVDDSQNILPEKDRALVMNNWLKWSLARDVREKNLDPDLS